MVTKNQKAKDSISIRQGTEQRVTAFRLWVIPGLRLPRRRAPAGRGRANEFSRGVHFGRAL